MSLRPRKVTRAVSGGHFQVQITYKSNWLSKKCRAYAEGDITKNATNEIDHSWPHVATEYTSTVRSSKPSEDQQLVPETWNSPAVNSSLLHNSVAFAGPLWTLEDDTLFYNESTANSQEILKKSSKCHPIKPCLGASVAEAANEASMTIPGELFGTPKNSDLDQSQAKELLNSHRPQADSWETKVVLQDNRSFGDGASSGTQLFQGLNDLGASVVETANEAAMMILDGQAQADSWEVLQDIRTFGDGASSGQFVSSTPNTSLDVGNSRELKMPSLSHQSQRDQRPSNPDKWLAGLGDQMKNLGVTATTVKDCRKLLSRLGPGTQPYNSLTDHILNMLCPMEEERRGLVTFKEQ